MAVLQVVGEAFAKGNVGADAAIEKVEGMGAEQVPQGFRQKMQLTQDLRAELQMDSQPPCQGMRGKEENRKKRYEKYSERHGYLR